MGNVIDLYSKCGNPLWCEDCKHFCDVFIDGEGRCDIDGHSTWYGCQICRRVELKMKHCAYCVETGEVLSSSTGNGLRRYLKDFLRVEKKHILRGASWAYKGKRTWHFFHGVRGTDET